ncbi:MAG: threonine synthase [Pseudomonadota bacterium]
MSLASASNAGVTATWSQAVLSGLASDGGLFLPQAIPQLTQAEIASLSDKSLAQIATDLAKRFLASEITEQELSVICSESFNFPLPIVKLTERLHILELFHGPTCAFKDFGARFMSRLFRHFWGERPDPLTVLVATSGDTGGAVANAFFDTSPNPPIRVAILFPRDKVTPIQRRQMTTLGHNITAYQIDGTFDDCQRLVKPALSDQELKKRVQLTSANSINIARLIPQMFYYAHTALQYRGQAAPIISVPSGNLGNITGALLAKLCGFQLSQLIAACNANRPFPDFLTHGSFNPSQSLETISNAMDVGNPSNFQRILKLCNADTTLVGAASVAKQISAYSISDHTTRQTIREIYDQHGYTLDPHTAVGVTALTRYLSDNPTINTPAVVAATAHPAKFSETVEAILGHPPELPPQLATLDGAPEQIISLSAQYEALKKAL